MAHAQEEALSKSETVMFITSSGPGTDRWLSRTVVQSGELVNKLDMSYIDWKKYENVLSQPKPPPPAAVSASTAANAAARSSSRTEQQQRPWQHKWQRAEPFPVGGAASVDTNTPQTNTSIMYESMNPFHTGTLSKNAPPTTTTTSTDTNYVGNTHNKAAHSRFLCNKAFTTRNTECLPMVESKAILHTKQQQQLQPQPQRISTNATNNNNNNNNNNLKISTKAQLYIACPVGRDGGQTGQTQKSWILKPPVPPPLNAITAETKEEKQRMWKEYRQAMKPFKNREFANAKRTIQRLTKRCAHELDEKDRVRLQRAQEAVAAHKAMLCQKTAMRWQRTKEEQTVTMISLADAATAVGNFPTSRTDYARQASTEISLSHAHTINNYSSSPISDEISEMNWRFGASSNKSSSSSDTTDGSIGRT